MPVNAALLVEKVGNHPLVLKRSLVLVSALAWLALVPATAPAWAKSAKDCEAIQNPMEYNSCLASLSPVRGSRAARAASRRPPPGYEARSGRAPSRTAAVGKKQVVLPQGALQVVNGRVRLAITPRD